MVAGMTDSVMTRFGGSLGQLSTSSLSRARLTPFQESGRSLRARPRLILLLLVCGHRARRSLAPRRDPCRRGLGGGVVALRRRLRLPLPPPQLVRAFRTVPGLRSTGEWYSGLTTSQRAEGGELLTRVLYDAARGHKAQACYHNLDLEHWRTEAAQ